MVGTYATWQDVFALLRKGVDFGYGTAEEPSDSSALTAILTLVHQDFEAELRLMSQVETPIDESLSPDMFEAARIICARRGTAEYLRQVNQNQGKDPEDSYVAYLANSSNELMKKLMMPHGTTADAIAPTHRRAFLPSVGTVAGTDDIDAKFGLANIQGGSGHW